MLKCCQAMLASSGDEQRLKWQNFGGAKHQQRLETQSYNTINNSKYRFNILCLKHTIIYCLVDETLDCLAECGADRDWLVVLNVRGINGKCFLVATRCLCLPTLSGTSGFKQTQILSSSRENTKTSVGLHFFIRRGKKTEARNSKSLYLGCRAAAQ